MTRIILIGLCLLWLTACRPGPSRPRSVSPTQDLVVEAESPSQSTLVGTHYWKAERGAAPRHLVAFPSDNTVFNRQKIAAQSLNDGVEADGPAAPRLDYVVRFEEPGIYYLWVRGRGEAGGASIIPGVNGMPLTETADFIGFFPAQYAWLGGLHDTGQRAAIAVDIPAEHTLTFWMLEDGFRFDKFMITADAQRIPE